MCWMARVLLLVLLSLPTTVLAGLPTGEFVLVSTVLPGPMQRATVPIYTHMTLTDDHMEFRFITSFMPSAADCEQMQKCEQVVNALGLDFELDKGHLMVTDQEVRTSPGMRIDHPDSDVPLIIEPMLRLLDGAKVSVGENEITFRPQGGPEARFLASGLEDARAAMAFARSFDESLHRLDRCVLRQISEVRLREASHLSEAEHHLLEAVEAAGVLSDLRAQGSYWILMPDAPEADSPQVQRMRTAASYLRVLSAAPSIFPEAESPEQAQAMVMEMLVSGADFDEELAEEHLTPNLAGLLQLSRYGTWTAGLLSKGEEVAERLCQSLLLE